MKAESRPLPPPQFTLVVGRHGTEVRFKGEVVKNATMVEVSTTASVADILHSRITIELNEPIPVEMKPEVLE
jgi:hypothetical protein